MSCAEESNPVPTPPDDDVLVTGMPAGPTDVIPMVRDWAWYDALYDYLEEIRDDYNGMRNSLDCLLRVNDLPGARSVDDVVEMQRHALTRAEQMGDEIDFRARQLCTGLAAHYSPANSLISRLTRDVYPY